ncbi:Ribonuclease H [Abeliophyllum distichum]|uniref:Ribonuclease H n=1 Tax=Abeliophyllum distichum TaxID=126358 RepID=A0ABD1RT73_9LAMI
MEKLVLSLITASRKLRLYFQSHSIDALTNLPLRQILQKSDTSRMQMKWRVGILLVSPDGHNLNCALRLEFKVSNNATEYEVLLPGLRLAQKMKARKLQIHSDL